MTDPAVAEYARRSAALRLRPPRDRDEAGAVLAARRRERATWAMPSAEEVLAAHGRVIDATLVLLWR